MPLHSITPLPNKALLGLWHLAEPAATLADHLPYLAHYAARQPTGRDATRATQWLAGRVLAHALLQNLTTAEAVLENDPNGRPYFRELPAAAVSLSHSGEWVAGVVALHGRVGIDVELIRPKVQQLAPRFLSATEQADAGTDLTKYGLYWSAKETLYKLHSRRGVVFKEQLQLDPFSRQTTGELTAHVLLDNLRTQHQIAYECPAPGYVLTYCVEP